MPKKIEPKEKVLFEAMVVFCVTQSEVLLAFKPGGTGKIGAGFWNGYGGGLNSGERLKTAALRELLEEARLKGKRSALQKGAVLMAHNRKKDGTQFDCKVHMFLLHEWKGIPKTTAEMTRPTWFRRARLPLRRMMPADRLWVPRMLAGERIIVEAWYGPGQKKLERAVKIRKAKPSELL